MAEGREESFGRKVKDDKSKGECRRVKSRRLASPHVASLSLFFVRREIDELIRVEKLTEYLPLISTTFHRRNVLVVLRRNLRSL